MFCFQVVSTIAGKSRFVVHNIFLSYTINGHVTTRIDIWQQGTFYFTFCSIKNKTFIKKQSELNCYLFDQFQAYVVFRGGYKEGIKIKPKTCRYGTSSNETNSINLQANFSEESDSFLVSLDIIFLSLNCIEEFEV